MPIHLIRVIPLALLATACVPGGGGGGGTDDATPPTADGTPPDAAPPTDACAPSCDGRACGADGCGGLCGDCLAAQTCTGAGLCVDVPQSCGDATCDPDAETCENCPADCGQCCGDGECTPEHGEDCARCPADCGCAEGETCDPAGVCEATCAPACTGRACGPDGCGGTCGDCAPDQTCDPDGQCIDRPAGCGDGTCDPDEDCANCPDDCGCADAQICQDRACVDLPDCADPCETPELAACTPDAFAYRLCAPDPEQPGCTTLTRRIPCADGRACQPDANRGATCEGTCREPEVILLVDRSSSMAGERWAFTHPTLIDAATRRDRTARLGLRPFPSGADGCAADATIPPAFEATDAFAAIEPPADTAQTPLAAAFDDLEAAYGDPVDGQSIVLITDGDETCAAERAAVDRAAAFRRRGVRTFVIGIGQQANHELLTAIAQAGDTREHYPVADADILRAALDDIFERLDTCACALDTQRCEGGARVTCTEVDGERGYRDPIDCPFGCDPEAGACYPVCDPADPAIRCQGDTATRCAPSGDGYLPVQECPDGCQDGPGCNLGCRPGELRCVGDQSEICAPGGDRFELDRDCAFGCHPDRGVCYPTCRPGEHRCDGDTLEQCADDGDGYAPARDCPHGCNPDTLDCNPLCRPGERGCDGDTVTLCAATGDRLEPSEHCGTACVPGEGCAPCAPYLDARCGADGLERCAPDGVDFDPIADCACNPDTAVCLPNRFQSNPEGSLRFDSVPLDASSGRLVIWDLRGSWSWVAAGTIPGIQAGVACRQMGWPGITGLDRNPTDSALWRTFFSCSGDERALHQCRTPNAINDNNEARLRCTEPEPDTAYCVVADKMSWWYQPDGIVRRTFCHQGCDRDTGHCRPDDGDRARCLDAWTVTDLSADDPDGPWIADGDLTRGLERHAQFASCTLRTTGDNDIYRFTAPAPGTYRFTTSGDDINGDTVLFARRHCVAELSEVACNDDIGDGDRYSQIEVALDADETVYVFVDSYTVAFRPPYRLTAERVP